MRNLIFLFSIAQVFLMVNSYLEYELNTRSSIFYNRQYPTNASVRNDYGFLVLLKICTGEQCHSCTGSMITGSTVLTSASCLCDYMNITVRRIFLISIFYQTR